jgi:hypothetical protein
MPTPYGGKVYLWSVGSWNRWPEANDAFLVAEEVTAGAVSLGGWLLAQQPAEVVKLPLAGRRLLALVSGPLLFEFCPLHGPSVIRGRRGSTQVWKPCKRDVGRNSRFPTTVQEYDRSADILVRFDRVGKLQADKNVRAPIACVAPRDVLVPAKLDSRTALPSELA